MIGGVFSFPVIAYFPAILLEQLSYNPAIFPTIIALLYLYPLILFLKRCPKFRMLYIQHHLCAYRNQVSKFRFCNRYLPHFPLIVVSII